jgi:hypothetical protein
MARRRKTKNIDETQSYEIQFEDWKAYYRFGINMAPKDLIPGAYWESSKVILTGRLATPVLANAGRARIEIEADPQMDDHWQQKPTILSAKAVGWMELPRGDDTLAFFISVPSRSLPCIMLAIQSGKVGYASISGTKLKWRRGTVLRVSLTTHREEE